MEEKKIEVSIKDELKDVLGSFKEDVATLIDKKITERFDKEEIGRIKQMLPLSKGEQKDIATFFKALIQRDFITAKALSEGTDSAGGYLVPEEFRAGVIDIMNDVGYTRKYGTVIRMNRDVLNIPKTTAKPSVSWVAEGNQISTGQPTFGQVQLTAKKAGVIVPVTTELFEDSAEDINAILFKYFAEAFATAEDNQAFQGDGTVFTGILAVSGTNAVTMGSGETSFANISADDLMDLIAAVPSRVAANGKFIMHRTVFALIKKLTDGSGNYLFDPADKTIWGYPVITADEMPSTSDDAADTAFVIFGDPSYLYLGDRRQMTIALADQATVGSDNLFEKEMIAVRATERVAISVAMPNAFAILKTAAS